ncbi:hypothetical protein [Streptomyces sp. NPDC001068]|uniref:hypothetical protein n=1 Tax=Streptomyces sp. NPDC001068 TaxID=3364544 RepID=UPI0036B0AA91
MVQAPTTESPRSSVYSRHAERRADGGRATPLGFPGACRVFASMTIVSYGPLPTSGTAGLRPPSTAGVPEHAAGAWARVPVSPLATLRRYGGGNAVAPEPGVVFACDRNTRTDIPPRDPVEF